MKDKNLDARAEELMAIDWPCVTAPVQGLGKAKAASDTPEQEAFKKAAQQLAKFLETRGAKVSYGVALEALSKSIGYENWRTLRSKLKAGDAAPKKSKVSGPRYSVNAVYLDNNQLYGDRLDASSPLEAALIVQLERLSDAGSITEVEVTDVIDRYTGQSVMAASFVHSWSLVPVTEAIAKCCELAKANLGEAPKRGIEAAEAWDAEYLAIDFWTTVCVDAEKEGHAWHNQRFTELLQELVRNPEFESDQGYKDQSANIDWEPTEFANSRGELLEVDPVELLKSLLELASKGLNLQENSDDCAQTGVLQVLELQLILSMYEDRLRMVFNGESVM